MHVNWLPRIWGGKSKGRARARTAVKFWLFPTVQKNSAHVLTNMPILHMKHAVKLLGRRDKYWLCVLLEGMYSLTNTEILPCCSTQSNQTCFHCSLSRCSSLICMRMTGTILHSLFVTFCERFLLPNLQNHFRFLLVKSSLLGVDNDTDNVAYLPLPSEGALFPDALPNMKLPK